MPLTKSKPYDLGSEAHAGQMELIDQMFEELYALGTQETDIIDGDILVRVDGDETITGRWLFTTGRIVLAQDTPVQGRNAGNTADDDLLVYSGTDFILGSDAAATVVEVLDAEIARVTATGVGVFGVPATRLNIFNNSIAATRTPTLRIENSTAATGGAPQQHSPMLEFIGHSWDTDGGFSLKQHIGIYLQSPTNTNPYSNLVFAQSRNDGTYPYTDEISLGSAEGNGSFSIRVRDGNFIFNRAGTRGIYWVANPLTDTIASSNGVLYGNTDGSVGIETNNSKAFVYGTYTASSTNEPALDVRAFQQSVYTVPISVLRLRAWPWDVPTAGFGNRIVFQAKLDYTAGAAFYDQGTIDVLWTAVSAGSESADLVFKLVTAGAAHAEKLRIRSTGLLTFGGTTSSQPALKPSSTVLEIRLADDSAYAELRALRAVVDAGERFGFSGRSRITSPADSDILLSNNAVTAFNLLQFGGTTSSFVALKRASAVLEVKLADDSAYAELKARYLRVSDAAFMVRSSAAWTDGAAAAAGTLLNAPAAGNPTKWIPVDDNGTTRYIPAW